MTRVKNARTAFHMLRAAIRALVVRSPLVRALVPPGTPSRRPRRRLPIWRGAAGVWLPEGMTVLVTRRHVDYVRVTTTGCPAA
ncbi:hypothetical protein GCM10010233_26760 [Streptomyces pseudogriseolus]|uniref:Uncharacterized protein n=1 Tax=Streptomyces pseudogriseolus TaxID=36817 RepID=A0ABQ2TB25_STREZ|nr:hypothetical protein GCM10010233_26760 [Streptomyces gancidicus]GGS58481.1 hypothetical protein GCM10010285_42360 [Streptomyces rubiginosus]